MEAQEILSLDDIGKIKTINKKILCSDTKRYMGFCKQACFLILESLSNNEEIFYLFYKYLRKEIETNQSLFNTRNFQFVINEIVNLLFFDLPKQGGNINKFIKNITFIIQVFSIEIPIRSF